MDIAAILMIWAATMIVLSAIFDNSSEINYTDLKVGDVLVISGEKFELLNFSPGGVLELREASGYKKYYLKLDNYIKLKREKSFDFSILKFVDEVELDGFKGSLRGENLDKIKFED